MSLRRVIILGFGWSNRLEAWAESPVSPHHGVTHVEPRFRRKADEKRKALAPLTLVDGAWENAGPSLEQFREILTGPNPLELEVPGPKVASSVGPKKRTSKAGPKKKAKKARRHQGNPFRRRRPR